MNKYVKIFLLIFLLICIDQFSKAYIFALPDSSFFHKHFNQYYLFGSFASATPEIKYLLTGIIFSTVLIVFFFIDFIFFSDQVLAEIGMWTLFSGIAGNMIDKIFLIGVRDFIPVFPQVYANLADITQWVGFIIFTYAIFKNADQIWHDKGQRKTLLVNPKEQIIFSLTISLLVLLVSIAFIFSTLSFLKLKNLDNDLKEIFLFLSIGLMFLATLASFIFSIFLSARIWGPMFSFKRHLQSQNENIFKTRKTDFFKDLDQHVNEKNQGAK